MIAKKDLYAGIVELDKTIEQASESLRFAPKGSLRLSQSGEKYSYFRIAMNGDGKTVKEYISRKNEKLISELAQKDYDIQVLKVAECQKAVLSKAALVYEENAIANISRKLHPERRKFVKFYEIPVADKVEQWKKVEYEGKAFADNMPVIKTRNGLRVRSKSEVIIADTFSEYKIPFRYKYPLKAGSSGVIYPDFTVLNPRTGQEFIFEHFERLSDPKYFRIMQTKLELYATCGYFLGENLLYTMGSNESPIDIEYLDKLIKHFLL